MKNTMFISANKKFITIIALLCLCFFLTDTSFAQLAKGQEKFLGNVIGNTIRSNFSKYWNQVTAENAGKWGSAEGGKDSYNWAPLDKIYDYALANNFPYKHHALVWGQQYPSWITTLDSANQRAQVEEWIKLVGERYPEMDFADVVNEPFNAPPPFANALGGSGKTGWDWVITSFELARKYLPDSTQLLLNEYNVLHNNTITDNYLKLIDTLKVRELIDGIAIQGHYFEFKGSGYSYSVSTIKSNLNKLTATGLPVYISEFDINEADDDVQLENYKTYFPIFWENPGVKGITLWGYVQHDIWKTNAYLLTERNVERPALKWLRTYLLSPMAPKIISPMGTTEVRNPILVWSASDSATSYNVQVSTTNTFNGIILDSTVTDTLLQLGVLDANKRYHWRVSASNAIGTSSYSAAGWFMTNDQTVGVEDFKETPDKYSLYQNYPNPFNPTTTISFSLPEKSHVRLFLVNIIGKTIKEITSGNFEAGLHQVKFDGSDLASGVYFYKMETESFIQVKKLILMK